MPWRRTREPWRVLVSEIMLQQTRVPVVIPYYERFLARYPEAADFAAAPEREVLGIWSGLGYYARARNLQGAASRIASGGFPRDYEGILALPGIGRYTAAAVGSICFDLPHAAVDGNVLRVVARVTNDAGDIGSRLTRARFEALAESWLPAGRAGLFNQAMMELGATVCLPRNPLCTACPVARVCAARREGTESQLPVKLRVGRAVRVESTLLLIERRGRVLAWRRPKGRMGGFWELPSPAQVAEAAMGAEVGTFRHTITNHLFRVRVVRASVGRAPVGFRWLGPRELAVNPLSTMLRKALSFVKIFE